MLSSNDRFMYSLCNEKLTTLFRSYSETVYYDMHCTEWLIFKRQGAHSFSSNLWLTVALAIKFCYFTSSPVYL